jgi:hypothetical protein
MGVWEFLTKQRGLDSPAFRWTEPWMFRIRLRGDLLRRIAVVLGNWGLATGILLVLFAKNVKPPEISLAVILGAVFGLGPAWLATFFLSYHTSGRVKITEEGIQRLRHYVSLSSQWLEWMEWPFEAIQRCMIVSEENSGHPFSLLLLFDGTDREVLGIPSRVDREELVEYFESQGVSVTERNRVPAEYIRPMALWTPICFASVGALVFGFGLVFYLTNVQPGQ